jgi:ATP adenylyltransferase
MKDKCSKLLWAPWRMAYIREARRPSCVFCAALAGGRGDGDAGSLILWRRELVFVMMNRFPYAHGHLLVSPVRHIKDLERLTAAEEQELMGVTRHAICVLKRCLSPEGFNVGLNLGKVAGAGFADHLHCHIVPRWEGDHNFMPILAETRVISEHLMDTYERLREGFHGTGTEPGS